MNDNDEGYSGGCQCGAIRFHAKALHDNPHVCHCRMCQKATGNFFAALVGVRHENMEWTRGTPSHFRSSEHVTRGFCKDCGTPLFYRYDGGERVSLSIGAFDEPRRIALAFQLGMEGLHPSIARLSEIPNFGTTEEEEGADEAAEIKATNRQHPDHDTSNWPT